jgi:DNA-binding transcriptional LysR family regulator
MNLRDLEAFLAVVESGSVVGAARKLNLTQPAITRRVQNLERDLGTALLRRDNKPPRLTVDGETIVAAGLSVRRAVNELRASIAADGEPCGQLRLGIAQAVGDLALGTPIGVLRRAYPRLTIGLHSGWSAGLMQQVAGGSLDGAAVLLRAGNEPPAQLHGEAVSTEEIVVVGAEHLAPAGPVQLHDLASLPWVLNPDGCGYRRAIRRALERQRLPFTVAVDLVGPETQLSAVAEGVGLGLVPRRVLAASRFHTVLREIAVADFRFAVAVWVVEAPALGRLQGPVACFRRALAKTLAETAPGRSPVQDCD